MIILSDTCTGEIVDRFSAIYQSYVMYVPQCLDCSIQLTAQQTHVDICCIYIYIYIYDLTYSDYPILHKYDILGIFTQVHQHLLKDAERPISKVVENRIMYSVI